MSIKNVENVFKSHITHIKALDRIIRTLSPDEGEAEAVHGSEVRVSMSECF